MSYKQILTMYMVHELANERFDGTLKFFWFVFSCLGSHNRVADLYFVILQRCAIYVVFLYLVVTLFCLYHRRYCLAACWVLPIKFCFLLFLWWTAMRACLKNYGECSKHFHTSTGEKTSLFLFFGSGLS